MLFRSGLRVCIVDDNGTNRTLLQHFADLWGMNYVSTESGPTALHALEAAHKRGASFDLVIVDQHMPGMDGFELSRHIKAQPDFAPMQIVMVSSFGRRGEVGRAKESGISGYLTKPVRRDHVYRCLTQVMGRGPSEENAQDGREQPPIVTLHTLREDEARKRVRILVAEDNIVNQKVAVRMLEKIGYRADVVGNGQEALEALGRIPYDVVLMDCQMPEMDGYEATREIRRREALSVKREGSLGNSQIQMTNDQKQNTLHVPIIAMTANAMKGDREKCFEAGMDDFLSKPVKIEVLAVTLVRWITKREEGEDREASGVKGEAETREVDNEPHMTKDTQRDTNDEIRTPSDEQRDPPLDMATLDGMRELGGDDPSFLSEVIQQFLQDGSRHLDAIRQAIGNGDAESLMKAAHAFKGSCGIMGANALAKHCFSLEQKGREGQAENLEDVLRELESEYSRVQVALEAELANLPTVST